MGKSSSKTSQLCKLNQRVIKWGEAVGEHWWPRGQDPSAPLLLPLAAKAGIKCWLNDGWNKSNNIAWGCVKPLFLLRVLLKCLFLLVNLRPLSHNLSGVCVSESVESKLGFSLSNAWKLFPGRKCLSSMFSTCLFFSFARHEGNKAMISASQNAVLIAAALQVESQRPAIVPN